MQYRFEIETIGMAEMADFFVKIGLTPAKRAQTVVGTLRRSGHGGEL